MKIWILFLCAIVAGVSAQSDEWNDGWNEDYDDAWFKTELEKLGIYSDEEKDTAGDADNASHLEKDQDEMDKVVEEDIRNFQDNEENDDDKIDDYQFEDNRSAQNEKLGEDDNAELNENINDEENQDINHEENNNDYDDYALKEDDDFEQDLPEDEDIEEPKFSKDDDTVPLESPKSSDEIKKIIEETDAILNEEEQKSNDFADEDTIQDNDEIDRIMEETKKILDEETNKPNDFDSEDEVQEDDNLSKIIKETNDILEEEDIKPNDFENNSGVQDSDIGKIIEETKAILDEESSKTNDFASNEISQNDDKFKLLRESLNDLGETGDIPKDPNSVDDEAEKEIDDNLSDNIVEEGEDTVDKVYEDLNADLEQLFETLNKIADDEIDDDDDDDKVKQADVDYAVNSDETLDDKSDYENIFDSNLSDIFAEHSKAVADENGSEIQADAEPGNDEVEEKDDQDVSLEAKESVEQVLLPYIDDALPSDDDVKEKSVKSVNVDELSDDQLADLMKDFKVQHSDAFDIEASSDDHIVNEISLEYGETKVIETDNYPSGYPTNRIVDWIVTGKGQGIELNVTDFAINSAMGDYLMVKPGQADDSGPDGLIFSYHLNEPRAYRFTDVDRIFLRFDSKLGMSWLRGFSITLKMIAPLPEEPEPAPEPEPVLPEPRHSLAVLLGGITVAEFNDTREDFRLLVADMATMYINANGIEPGMNTTAEITQIISSSICNVNWPGYEECAHVRFSVPLVYEDEDEDEYRLHEMDLQTMWDTYVATDPFAARLRQMGIEEFTVPNDGGVLTVWLVVALGVMVSAAMLAIALWRYTCFEDYTRMPVYSDTDSLQEKRSSLYPTPHQMLPPLYADSDYNSTKVDMGGYENRSYTRTNMYDLDSDEEAVVTRDSNHGSIQPRDMFGV